MQLPAGFTISQMRQDEVDTLRQWAATEGWNPGHADLQLAWQVDPDAFIALRRQDALVGAGTIFRYNDQFGFMGLFIVRPDFRNQGLGTVLWNWRRDALLQRLHPGASIGMDGVFEMVPFYEKGGFKPTYRHLRYQGTASAQGSERAERLSLTDFDAIADFDRAFFPVPRTAFLKAWLSQDGVQIVGIRDNDNIIAYGVARTCEVGYKIGPLFAASRELAEDVLRALLTGTAGQQVQIDVPEANTQAVHLAESFGLSMTFGCMRLYHGAQPDLPVDQIFSVTSLEFG